MAFLEVIINKMSQNGLMKAEGWNWLSLTAICGVFNYSESFYCAELPWQHFKAAGRHWKVSTPYKICVKLCNLLFYWVEVCLVIFCIRFWFNTCSVKDFHTADVSLCYAVPTVLHFCHWAVSLCFHIFFCLFFKFWMSVDANKLCVFILYSFKRKFYQNF